MKICGIRSTDDASAAIAAGASWIGLNFVIGSRRSIDLDQARQILEGFPRPWPVEPVGLFVDQSALRVQRTAESLGLRIVQLHGTEPPDDVATLQAAGFQVVKAFRLSDLPDIEAMTSYLAQVEPDAVLIDGSRGGAGVTIPDPIIDRIPPIARLILAGGLTPENVAERVGRVRPWMVDVASGVESGPGVKSPGRMAAFVRAVRGDD